MTDAELPQFHELLKRLCVTFRVRADDENFRTLSMSYFQVLRRYSILELTRGADAWMAAQTKFPKPAEWKQAIPRREFFEAQTMTDAEGREWRRAEVAGWEDPPCQCRECVQHGVNDRPLRFVPDVDGEDRDIKAKHPWLQQPVTRGHWAHGAELARWYAARADFYEQYLRLTGGAQKKAKKQRVPFLQRLEQIYSAKREKDADMTSVGDVLTKV